MLEDTPTDAELILRVLQDDGLAVTAKRVETEQAFVAALEQFTRDVVLADVKLPSYDGLSAITRRTGRSVCVVYGQSIGSEK